MKKVSIVIPVYNAINYIDKCIESLLSQTYSDIEILLVNDGSTDNTLSKLKKIEKDNKKKVKVFNKKNGGQSSARNYGIKYAKGYYITFVDQDDFVKTDFIEKMVAGINDNDILISGFNRYIDNDKLIQENIPKVCEWSKFKYCATWGKLYKLDFLKKYSIIFGNYKIGEDVIFLMDSLSKTNKVAVISYAGYNNYRNTSSISRTINKNKETRNKIIDMLKIIEKDISKENFDLDLLMYFYLKTSVLHLFVQRHILSMKELYSEYKQYFNWLKRINKKYNKKLKFNFQNGEEKKINFFVNSFLLSHKIHLSYIYLLVLKLIKEQYIE